MLSFKNVVYFSDLSDQFSNKILRKYAAYSEIYVVFDTYKEDSLKSLERFRRQNGTDSIRYRIDDKTSLKNTNIKKLLSHTSTKEDITPYFSKYPIASGNRSNQKNLLLFQKYSSCYNCLRCYDGFTKFA